MQNKTRYTYLILLSRLGEDNYIGTFFWKKIFDLYVLVSSPASNKFCSNNWFISTFVYSYSVSKQNFLQHSIKLKTIFIHNCLIMYSLFYTFLIYNNTRYLLLPVINDYHCTSKCLMYMKSTALWQNNNSSHSIET